MFLHMSVCPQGGGLPQCMLRLPPGADIPPDQAPPPGADTLPGETATAADDVHPTGMHSCFIIEFLRIADVYQDFPSTSVRNPEIGTILSGYVLISTCMGCWSFSQWRKITYFVGFLPIEFLQMDAIVQKN